MEEGNGQVEVLVDRIQQYIFNNLISTLCIQILRYLDKDGKVK